MKKNQTTMITMMINDKGDGAIKHPLNWGFPCDCSGIVYDCVQQHASRYFSMQPPTTSLITSPASEPTISVVERTPVFI